MKKFKLIGGFALSLALIFVCGTVSVFATTHYISDVNWYKQLNTRWCWAAVSESIIDKETPSFTAGSFANRQSRIVNIAKGSVTNTTGTTSDMIKAMKSINSSAFRNATWDYISGTSEFKDIMDEILADDIVGINLYDERPPYVSGKSYKGHSTFAYWVDDTHDNILLSDPWRTSNHIDVYKSDLLYDGFYCHAYPSTVMYGGIYLT